jgi:hypothetical protein
MSEAFIYDHVRTPRGRGKPDGALHEVTPVRLAAGVLGVLRDRSNLDTGLVDDVVLGCVGLDEKPAVASMSIRPGPKNASGTVSRTNTLCTARALRLRPICWSGSTRVRFIIQGTPRLARLRPHEAGHLHSGRGKTDGNLEPDSTREGFH